MRQTNNPSGAPPSYVVNDGSLNHQVVANEVKNPKSVVDAYLLAIPFGLLGAHHFYLRRYGFGVLYIFTLGFLGFGYLFDLCRMPCLVKEANQKLTEHQAGPQMRTLGDAYVLWFPFGIIGFHQFYLGRPFWGIAYLFSLGLFGIGWLVDGVRMKWLVEECNERAKQAGPAPPKDLAVAYALGLFPLSGFLGFHHYYLGRPGFGVIYTFSLGLLGVGYVVDWFRMPCLVKDANKRQREGDDGTKSLCDAYLLLFPLGFLGLHHYYLERHGWGLLYFLTFGCLGIGWIMDFCRLPSLVKEYNQNNQKIYVQPQPVVRETCQQLPYPAGFQPYYPGGYDNPCLTTRDLEGGQTYSTEYRPPCQPTAYPVMYPYPQQMPQNGWGGPLTAYPPEGLPNVAQANLPPPSYEEVTEEASVPHLEQKKPQ